MRELKTICLTCGANGSGISSAVGMQMSLPNSDGLYFYPIVLMNAGDGLQRSCMDNCIKLNKLKIITITSLCPHNVSGLPGLILYLSGIGLAELILIGPPGLTAYVDAYKLFANKKYPQCTIVEITVENSQVLNVQEMKLHLCIHMLPVRNGDIITSVCYCIKEQSNCPSSSMENVVRLSSVLLACIPISFGSTDTNADVSSLLRWIVPSSNTSNTGLMQPYNISCVLFILLECVSNNPNPGRGRSKLWVDVMKTLLADEWRNKLFVQTSVLYDMGLQDALECRTAQLQNILLQTSCSYYPSSTNGIMNEYKKSVQLVTHPDSSVAEAMDEPVNQLDCPTLRHVSFTNSTRFFCAIPNLCVDLVLGIVEPSAANGFSGLFADNKIKVSVLSNHRRKSNKLIHQIMQLKQMKLDVDAMRTVSSHVGNEVCLPNNTLDTNNANRSTSQLLKLQLLKKRKVDGDMTDSCVVSSDHTSLVGIPTHTTPPPPPPPYPRPAVPQIPVHPTEWTVTCLGTGCAAPSRYRGNTSVLLNNHSPSRSLIMLDVGEGTSMQLFYHCNGNVAEYFSTLIDIDMIWISHHHADHISGLSMLMEHIRRARLNIKTVVVPNQHRNRPSPISDVQLNKKILIIASMNILTYIETVLSLCGLFDMVDCYPIAMTNQINMLANQRVHAATKGWVHAIISVPVVHCMNAHALVLIFSDGRKLAYSGDCRPVISSDTVEVMMNPQVNTLPVIHSRTFLNHAMNCDILVHEATFDESLSEDAIAKRHSTINEAIFVGAQIHAKFILLTHFSQRYPVNIEPSSADASLNNVIYASDLLTIPFPTYWNREIVMKELKESLDLLRKVSVDDDVETETLGIKVMGDVD